MKFVERIYPDKRILFIIFFFFLTSQIFLLIKHLYPFLIEYHPYALLKCKSYKTECRLLQKDNLRFFYDTQTQKIRPLSELFLYPEDFKPLKEGYIEVEFEGQKAILVPYREVFWHKLFRKLGKNLKLLFTFIFGLVLLRYLSSINCKKLKNKKLIYTLVILSLVSLIIVAIRKFLSNSTAPERWLFGTSIQPSEFSKVVLILFLAYYISNKGSLTQWKNFLWVMFMVLGHAALLVVQPDLGMAFFVLLLSITLIWIGGVAKRIIITSLILFLVFTGGALYIFFSKHVGERLKSWIDPFADPYDAGYQIIKSLQAITNGGILGEGLGKGLHAALYIRESDTDYIISLIIENVGVVGFTVIFFLQFLLIIRLLKISTHIYSVFERIVVIGVALNMAYAILVNYAMAFNLLPPKGIALPFISYGISNYLSHIIGLGIVGSIYRRYLSVLN